MTATIVYHGITATIAHGVWSAEPPELARGLTTVGENYTVTGADPDPDRAIAASVARVMGATLLPAEQHGSLPPGTVAGQPPYPNSATPADQLA
jgi:hypothetical protein